MSAKKLKKIFTLWVSILGIFTTGGHLLSEEGRSESQVSRYGLELNKIYNQLNVVDLMDLPIGVFDSGTGGLTVLEQILCIDEFKNMTLEQQDGGDGLNDFKNENFIFLADQANMPYGNYPVVGKVNFLEELIMKDAAFLMGGGSIEVGRFDDGLPSEENDRKPVKAIVIACNTATAYGQDDIEELVRISGHNIPVVGVIEAGSKGAIESLMDRPGRIAIMPTMGTVLSNAYPVAIEKILSQTNQNYPVTVVQQGAFGLAGAIDGAMDFISSKVTSHSPRDDYRGPSISNKEHTIRTEIMARYNFDFSNNRMLYKGDISHPNELQINSVENYISYHLVTLMEKLIREDKNPPLRALVMGCTHFPFYKNFFDIELKRLREYKENGEYIYREFMDDHVELIDPAYFTARELYTKLFSIDRLKVADDSPKNSQFYITAPDPGVGQENLNEQGEFNYNYKYGRNAADTKSTYNAYPIDTNTVKEPVLERLMQDVPAVWNLISSEISKGNKEFIDAHIKINRIEQVIGEDIGNRRGIDALVNFSKGGLLGASLSLTDEPNPHVGILTRFYFPYSTPPACETDGPPGAAHLALSFYRTGIPCRIVTDTLSAEVVNASLWGAGLPGDFPVDKVSLAQDLNDGGEKLETVIQRWLELDPPITHVISIERAGPAADGYCYSFSGLNMSEYNAPLHLLYNAGDWVRIGIGDGGNEIGMGNLPRNLVNRNVRDGSKVACVIPCDYLIVCGTSNWGGYAIPAAMSLLKPELSSRLLSGLNPETDYQILRVAVEKGNAAALESFDSNKAYPSMSVDALPWIIHSGKLREIKNVIK